MLKRSRIVRHGVLRGDEFSAAGVDIGGGHDAEKVLKMVNAKSIQSVSSVCVRQICSIGWGRGEGKKNQHCAVL